MIQEITILQIQQFKMQMALLLILKIIILLQTQHLIINITLINRKNRIRKIKTNQC
jgi:hypothetical protein